jgi:hypothetical protein
MSVKLTSLLNTYIQNPDYFDNNFNLGLYYEEIGQTASALSYYLRASERTEDYDLRYECLLRASICFTRQGSRNFTVKGLLQNAITTCPERPEAYYLLSVYHESENKDGCWNDCYLIASIGEIISRDKLIKPLITNVNYPGYYGIIFQKAVSGWWCGLCEESRNLFKDLLSNYSITNYYRRLCFNNLFKIDQNYKFVPYSNTEFDRLKYKFKHSEKIQNNYSEAYQDMFVLSMLDGKECGTYFEIGSADPFYGNNTALLEKEYKWKGISLDINEDFVNNFAENRSNKVILADALEVNYNEILSDLTDNGTIDYLQIDCDPPEVTYNILRKIPFDQFKFAVITFEHDFYSDQSESIKYNSREYLTSLGYELVVSNVSANDWRDYEDWWVHPDLVSREIINMIKNTDESIKNAKTVILES